MTRTDDILIQRLLDGELPEAEATALRERLKAEPALRRVLTEQRSVSRWFDAARREEGGGGPVAGRPRGDLANRDLANRVLAAVRAGEHVAAPDSVRFARRIALAAAFVMAVTILWALAVSDRGRGRVLDASPDQLRQEVERVERTELPPKARQALSSWRIPHGDASRSPRTESRPAAQRR